MSVTPLSQPETKAAQQPKPGTQYVFFFGAGKAEGNGKMKEELGGKGAGLAEMTNAGLPVPPGFTIQTAACREFMKTGKVSDALERQMKDALARLEELQKQKLGAGENPLLVSVRSGAKFSMPGMMDTILNLGLNDESVKALARKSGNERFAYDSYRRLIQMYGNVVLDIPKAEFEEVFDGQKRKRGVKMDTELTAADLQDVVSGVRTPVHILELHKLMPQVYDQLRDITTRLENHYRDMQDFEFTIQEGRLYMLQTRNGKRTGRAAVRVALDMVKEGLIKPEEAIFRVEPNQLYDFLVPSLDEKGGAVEVIAKGLPASPGAAVGRIVFTANDAVTAAGTGAQKNPVILVRGETTPEDIHGMEVAAGILTSRGGMTSHAAVVTRGMGKCCVVGAGEIEVDDKKKQMRIGDLILKEGDWISIDGISGRVIKGQLGTVPAKPDDPDLQTLLKWSEPFRKLGVRANADIPRDAIAARSFGAEGIGLCRTELMFFAEDRIGHMRDMILARTEGERKKALAKLLPVQREDFEGVFKAMDGFPVTIRLLDPPLHEFPPRREELMVEIAQLEIKDANSPRLKEARELLRRVEELHELNPMLGHRGCRLGITYPEISEMQARAIFEAAVNVSKAGVKVFPEVMVPLVGMVKEMENQGAIIRQVAEQVFKEKGTRVEYMVGTMIELPRACSVADQIASDAEFFSFGTNDLTQTAYGFSRDDISKFLPAYIERGILKSDPFATIDQEGVGELMQTAVKKGRKTRSNLKIGICGEHGGDPASVEFCHKIGLNYVSCSPYRVLTARLAAAQAAAAEELKTEGGRTK